MPREDRRVIFDYSEAYQALYKLSLKQPEAPRLKPGVIQHIEEDSHDSSKIHVMLENVQTGEKQKVTYTKDFVAAALMMFCRGAGIPLPRQAGKSIMLVKDKPELILRVIV